MNQHDNDVQVAQANCPRCGIGFELRTQFLGTKFITDVLFDKYFDPYKSPGDELRVALTRDELYKVFMDLDVGNDLERTAIMERLFPEGDK